MYVDCVGFLLSLFFIFKWQFRRGFNSKHKIIMNLLTTEFLESKLLYRVVTGYGECLYKSSDGNIKQISDKLFSFVQHNLLPGTDGQLDGHYKFYVNPYTFEYLLYKESFYGGFTYTTESNNIDWVTNLIPREKGMIESIIAHKLLMSYYYDHNAVNSSGKNLISDGKCEPAGGGFNPDIVRWLDGYGKSCLITDYRGHIWSDLKPNERSEKDLEAIKLLDKEYNIKYVKSVTPMDVQDKKDVAMSLDKKVSINGVEYYIPLNVEFLDDTVDVYYIHRVLFGEHFHYSYILDKDKNKLCDMSISYKGEDKGLIDIIPKFIESL